MGRNCAKCNKYIEEKNKTYANTIAKIRNKCKLDIICDNLEDSDGFEMRIDNRWNPFSKIHILIVIDCCIGANEKQESSEDTFGHELTHALDECNKRDAGLDCESSICREMRAYTVGGCKGLIGNELKECLKDRVPASSRDYCDVGDDQMKKMVEQNFERCLQGYPH